jgi:hypothetical protein
MAIIILKTNKAIPMQPDKALAIWNVFNGNEKGTKAQQEYVEKIKRIYLNMANAPDDYRERYGGTPRPKTQGELMEERYK